MKSAVSRVEPLTFPMKTLDPFLFCVYHRDLYPAGDEKMQAPRKGNGADFNPSAPYRMYHGDRVPGFPQHPHRGFETVTATVKGLIDHTDSHGNAGRYGHGDLQWMTAGKGVVHGEMFPLVNPDKPNPLTLFQIWLNLPKVSKMVEPAFKMHWAEDIPKVVTDEGKVKVTVWAGSFGGKVALTPTPDSWAMNPRSNLGIYYIIIQPGGKVTLPGVSDGDNTLVNRMAYFVEGSNLQITGQNIPPSTGVTLNAALDAEFCNNNTDGEPAELLILQGSPIGEPVAQRGPFVMNTDQEIQQAFMDYQRTQFGGWPWPQDAMVFPREKGRFAVENGVEAYPPVAVASADVPDL